MVTNAAASRSTVALMCLLTTGIWFEAKTAAAEPVAGVSRPEYQNVDQVVTTARRREESVQDVPGTISVLPEALMRRLGVESLADLSVIAPNLLVAPDNVSSRASRITLRSQVQNDTLITVDPA
jgi:iron complex outermembrane receptor protein